MPADALARRLLGLTLRMPPVAWRNRQSCTHSVVRPGVVVLPSATDTPLPLVVVFCRGCGHRWAEVAS